MDSYEQSSNTTNSYTTNNYSALGNALNFLNNIQSLSYNNAQFSQISQLQATSAAQTRYSDNRVSILNNAVTEIENGNIDTGRQMALQLIEKNGRDAGASHVVGRSYMAEGNYEMAEQYFARAASLSPSMSRYSQDRDIAKALQQTDEIALAEAQRMVSQSENRIEGIRLLGYLVKRSPSYAEAHITLGDAMMEEDWVVQSVMSYQNALATAEGNTLDKLTERLQTLAAQAPDIGLPHNLLGQALSKQGRYDEALLEMQKAVDIQPTNQSYLKNVADIYGNMGSEALENGKPLDAIRYYQNGLEVDRTSDTLHGGLAEAHVSMSRWWVSRGLNARAFKELTAAQIEVRSDQTDIKKDIAKGFFNLGDRYETKDDLSWAVTAYERAFKLDSSNSTYRSRYALAADAKGVEFFQAKDYENAEYYYQKAADAMPGNETYQLHLKLAQDAQ